MFSVDFKGCAKRSRWRRLSTAGTDRQASRQMFGWMALFSGKWAQTEEEGMTPLNHLIETLKARQAVIEAPGVLHQCEMAGVEVRVDGETLRIKGPLTDELRTAIKQCKPELLKLLKGVPVWDQSKYLDCLQRVKDTHERVRPQLHPHEDDCLSIAARNVLADALASLAQAHAVRRIDLYESRTDWILGWFQTLDSTISELRTPGAWKKRGPVDLTEFEGVGFTKRDAA